MTTLVTNQACLVKCLRRIARVVIVQKNFRFYESLFMPSFCVISEALLFLFSDFFLKCSALRLMMERQELHSSAFSPQDSNKLHFLRSPDTISFQRRFCPLTLRLQPTRVDTRSCLDRRSLDILERCPRKRRRLCKRIDEILSCLASCVS